MSPIIRYSGLDWSSFLWDLFVVICLSVAISFPVKWATQGVVAICCADVVDYFQVLPCVFAAVLFVWFVVVKTYPFWSSFLKLE